MERKTVQLEVAVALPVHGTFTYLAPGHLQPLAVGGRRVLIPFGNRRVTGYVLGNAKIQEDRDIKDILDVMDDGPLFTPDLVPFFRWTAAYYHHPIGEVIRSALPGGLNLYEYTVLSIVKHQCPLPPRANLTDAEKAILDCLSKGSCTLSQLSAHLNRPVSGALIQAMERCGWITRKKELRGGRIRPRTETIVRLVSGEIPGKRITVQRRLLLDRLLKTPEMPLIACLPSARSILTLMQRDGFVAFEERSVYRDPFGDAVMPDTPPVLNAEQRHAVDRITENLQSDFGVFLLEGVTGSGKTEVYLQAADRALAAGRNVMILVPEIAIIAQTERRFRARFGNRVALLHSGLSAGERLDQWNRTLTGDAKIVVGARSAVFAPFDRIGLIVVDEEHDPSYKQDTGLRYNARDLAIIRGRMNSCPVVLGSATPSIQSMHHADEERYTRLILSRRIADRPLPTVDIIDLREIRDHRGMGKYLTPALLTAVKDTLARKEQTLLFLNRRGFSSYPVCMSCGAPLKCRHCDITLTLHQKANAYRCHYCAHSRPSNSVCDRCGSTQIWHMGLGTEKVESYLKERFPEARIDRMDRDTMNRRGRLVSVLKALRRREIDILVGTQMVAKGHDFPHITLVGIVCADLSLSFPDFRSGERTFQLLAQVAGRAGRGDQPGRVILQTYNPDHFSIQAAREQNVRQFFDQEAAFRKALGYPPFSRMAQIRISSRDIHRGAAATKRVGERGRLLVNESPDYRSTLRLLGPLEAPLTKIAGRHRWQMLIISARSDRLHRFIDALMADDTLTRGGRDVHLSVDIDPVFMM
ncbi:MAG: primosomal protein N' [Desulfobacterales bacterium]|jgi:primosomal protein N' (replication factor Y)